MRVGYMSAVLPVNPPCSLVSSKQHLCRSAVIACYDLEDLTTMVANVFIFLQTEAVLTYRNLSGLKKHTHFFAIVGLPQCIP